MYIKIGLNHHSSVGTHIAIFMLQSASNRLHMCVLCHLKLFLLLFGHLCSLKTSRFLPLKREFVLTAVACWGSGSGVQ